MEQTRDTGIQGKGKCDIVPERFNQQEILQTIIDKICVSAKIFEPNNSVIFQRIFVKFKMQIHILDGEE
jgi:hypothetical protein